MAIPATPTQIGLTQANLQLYLQWALTPTATSYSVQRSVDGVNYSVVATPTLPNYLDTTVSSGVMYWYNVAAVNGSGTSAYSPAYEMVAAPTGEMSLFEMRLHSKQTADRVNSNFVSIAEWNSFIGLAMTELYDLLVTVYEDYFKAPNATFITNNSQNLYPLPNGVLTFTGDNGSSFVAAPFYKLLGVDLALNTAQNAWVTMGKYMLIDRNKYLYPNSNSTIYGWQNAQYRMLGNNLEFIPVPAGNQKIRILYIPRLQQLLQDTDLSTIGFSGWLRYVIVRAAIYALNKEESDVSSLTMELQWLKQRIEASSVNRDAGLPDTVSDSRFNTGWSGSGGFPGPVGGF